MKRFDIAGPPARVAPRGDVRTADILLIGLSSREVDTLPSRLFGALAGGAAAKRFEDLDAAALEGVMAILSPVVAATFDAVEMATRLHELGWSGRYIAYVTDPIDERVVRAEVRAAAPGIAFEIVTMGHGPRLSAG